MMGLTAGVLGFKETPLVVDCGRCRLGFSLAWSCVSVAASPLDLETCPALWWSLPDTTTPGLGCARLGTGVVLFSPHLQAFQWGAMVIVFSCAMLYGVEDNSIGALSANKGLLESCICTSNGVDLALVFWSAGFSFEDIESNTHGLKDQNRPDSSPSCLPRSRPISTWLTGKNSPSTFVRSFMLKAWIPRISSTKN